MSQIIPKETKDWLLEADEPYIRYQAQLLLEPKKADSKLLAKDPFIKEHVQSLKTWKDTILRQHNKPDLLIHKLAMLADLGVNASFAGMKTAIQTILKSANDQGVPQLKIEIPTNFGGSGKPEWSWIACDFPTILYGLLKMDVRTEVTEKAVGTLKQLVHEDGMRCVGAFPKFKGPGRKEDICPYANLITAKALKEAKGGTASKAARQCVEALLGHWEMQKQKKYFLFGIGTQFRRLKYPFVWYDLLHMLEVISSFKAYRNDNRFFEMVQTLMTKTDDTFRFKPESIYMVYKKQEFSNKKEYSRLITIKALTILKRIGVVSS